MNRKAFVIEVEYSKTEKVIAHADCLHQAELLVWEHSKKMTKSGFRVNIVGVREELYPDNNLALDNLERLPDEKI